MGLNFISVSSYPEMTVKPKKQKRPRGNPDPARYEIIRSFQHGANLAIELRYPDCDNYEGRKILVYRKATIEQLLQQKWIDPHFSRGAYLSPFARFEPTEDGWAQATILLTLI